MHPFWEKVERWNSRLIPPALALLLIIIIFSFIPHDEETSKIISIADGVVVAIFVIDLIFLAIKARSVKFFFSNYWLDVLAIFPFGLIFKSMDALYSGLAAAERFVIGQQILHEAVEVEKEAKFLSRGERLAKLFRGSARVLRFLSKTRLWLIWNKPRKRK